jgi:DNA-nicking Smr family endonuclease
MLFKIGEKVRFLTDTGEGTVMSFKGSQTVIVEDETGFEQEYPSSQLVKIYGDQSDAIQDDYDIEMAGEAQLSRTTNGAEVSDVVQRKGYWEIDLHTHALLETEAGMTSGELLNHQLFELKRFYRRAKEKKIRKIVIIHGIGMGVLKSEVRHFLEGQENVAFYDADYREYGKGATEVELYYG